MRRLRLKTFVSSTDGPDAVGARLVEHARKLVSACPEIKLEDTAIRMENSSPGTPFEPLTSRTF